MRLPNAADRVAVDRNVVSGGATNLKYRHGAVLTPQSRERGKGSRRACNKEDVLSGAARMTVSDMAMVETEWRKLMEATGRC
jgi:hypothetical protein